MTYLTAEEEKELVDEAIRRTVYPKYDRRAKEAMYTMLSVIKDKYELKRKKK